MKKKLVRIFGFYYNIDNIVDIEPNYKTDVDTKEKTEIGCTIWYNCSMSNEVFHTDITFGKNEDGSIKHTTDEVANHLNRGKNLDN